MRGCLYLKLLVRVSESLGSYGCAGSGIRDIPVQLRGLVSTEMATALRQVLRGGACMAGVFTLIKVSLSSPDF